MDKFEADRISEILKMSDRESDSGMFIDFHTGYSGDFFRVLAHYGLKAVELPYGLAWKKEVGKEGKR